MMLEATGGHFLAKPRNWRQAPCSLETSEADPRGFDAQFTMYLEQQPKRRTSVNRRQFLSTGSAAALALRTKPACADTASHSPTPARMKLGDQTSPTNEAHLKYLARYGVGNICGYPEIQGDRLYATVDELKRMTDLAAKYDIAIDCIAPPFLESSFIDKEKHPAIMLAESPERDRDIEQLQTYIRNCALAGIPAVKYNMSILGVLRSGRIPGRGDALYHQ